MNKLVIVAGLVILAGLFFGCTSQSTDGTGDLVMMDNNAPSYTLADVAKHNTSSDCWTAINGNVYDLTPFIGSHPGGPIIATACGIDGSVLYNLRPTHNKGPHPKQAEAELAKLYLGPLAN